MSECQLVEEGFRGAQRGFSLDTDLLWDRTRAVDAEAALSVQGGVAEITQPTRSCTKLSIGRRFSAGLTSSSARIRGRLLANCTELGGAVLDSPGTLYDTFSVYLPAYHEVQLTT